MAVSHTSAVVAMAPAPSPLDPGLARRTAPGGHFRVMSRMCYTLLANGRKVLTEAPGPLT